MAQYNLQAILETQVIDKLLFVMKQKDTELEAKIAKLGTNVGSASTWAALPTVDHNGAAVDVGDVATLTQTDGNHPAGKYERLPDNSGWEDQPYINFDEIGLQHTLDLLKADLSPNWTTDADGFPTSAIDDKFTTPKQVADAFGEVKTALQAIYHPKGGIDTLKVVGANADENTQEFVTANQLSATFTNQQVLDKYNNL